MAHRRMFAIKIINSAKFLKMPSSSRLLYFDLGMRADDDGVVEAFNVLRMTGASEDDLRILAAKGYIKILNEDLVTYIADWRESNQLRADRKIDTMYKDLLLQIVPEIKLLESKTRADRKNKSGTSQGQPEDNQGTEEYSIGQYSIGESSVGKVNSSSIEFEEEELKEVMFLCQSLDFKLKKINAKNLIEVFGSVCVKKAIGIAVNTEAFRDNRIKNYGSYLGTVLKDLNKEKKVDITINKAKNKFTNYEQRPNMSKEEEEELLWLPGEGL